MQNRAYVVKNRAYIIKKNGDRVIKRRVVL